MLDIDAPPAMRTSLYTALYHALLAPSIAGDADGRYRGTDNQVHKADGFAFRSTFSLWDTFRAQQPLLTLVQPEEVNAGIVRSLIASRQDSPFGILPVWQFQGRETWTMIGYHAVPVIADAYLKGIRGFDCRCRARCDGRERQLRSLWRPLRLYEAGLCPDRQGARSGVQDGRICL